MTKTELIRELAKCDLTKSDLKDILINNFLNDRGFIDLSGLLLRKFRIDLSNIEAITIYNDRQRASSLIYNAKQWAGEINNSQQKSEEIDNSFQKAEDVIKNNLQRARVIYNDRQWVKDNICNSSQTAKKIDNSYQIAEEIKTIFQKAENITFSEEEKKAMKEFIESLKIVKKEE